MLAVHVRGGIASDNGVIFMYAAAAINVLLASPYLLIYADPTALYKGYLLVAMSLQILHTVVLVAGALFAEPDQRSFYVLSSSLIFAVYLFFPLLKMSGVTCITLPQPPPLDLEHYVERFGCAIAAVRCVTQKCRTDTTIGCDPLTLQAIHYHCHGRDDQRYEDSVNGEVEFQCQTDHSLLLQVSRCLSSHTQLSST